MRSPGHASPAPVRVEPVLDLVRPARVRLLPALVEAARGFLGQGRVLPGRLVRGITLMRRVRGWVSGGHVPRALVGGEIARRLVPAKAAGCRRRLAQVVQVGFLECRAPTRP